MAVGKTVLKLFTRLMTITATVDQGLQVILEHLEASAQELKKLNEICWDEDENIPIAAPSIKEMEAIRETVLDMQADLMELNTARQILD